MYVFVKAHGGAKTSLKGYDLLNCSIGVSQNFFNNYNAVQKPAPKKGRKKKTVKEGIETSTVTMLKQAEMSGIQGVATNAINSTYQHFMGMTNGMNESKVIKLKENELMELIKEAVKKIL
jgi:hypothetical protein